MKSPMFTFGLWICLGLASTNAHAFYDASQLQDADPQVDAFAGNVVALGVDGHFCSGLLVGESMILTAAHCFFDKKKIVDPMPLDSKLVGRALEVLRFNPKDPQKPYRHSIEKYSVVAPQDFKNKWDSESGDIALVSFRTKFPNSFSDKLIEINDAWVADALGRCKAGDPCLLYALSARKGDFNFVVTNKFQKISLEPRRSFFVLTAYDKDFIGEGGDSGSPVILCENMHDAAGCRLVGNYVSSNSWTQPWEGRISTTVWYEVLKRRSGEGFLVFCADNAGGTSCERPLS